jgi:hypothetical protein
VERGLLSEYFPSIPIMSALMGKTTEGATASATPGSAGFKGFAMVRQLLCNVHGACSSTSHDITIRICCCHFQCLESRPGPSP